jgi:superfamily II DNA or RNA helicase
MLVLQAAIGIDGELLVWGAPSPEAAGPSVQLLEAVLSAGCPLLEPDELTPGSTSAQLPSGACDVATLELAPAATFDVLATLAEHHQRAPVPGVAVGSTFAPLAELARLAGAIVLRQELVPDVRRRGVQLHARWSPLPGVALRDAIDERARRLPDAAHALGAAAAAPRRLLVERFLARLVDALVRARLARAPVDLLLDPDASVHDRWLAALVGEDPQVHAPPDALDRLQEQLGSWQARVRSAAVAPFRACLRLEEPDDPGDADAEDEGAGRWTLRFLLQLREDPSVLVDAASAWAPTGADAQVLAAHGFHAGAHLLAPLGEAAQLFEPLADALRNERPASCELTTDQAHQFLSGVAPLLEQAGIGVFVPAWWRSRGGRFQLSLRATLRDELGGGRRMLDSLNLATLVGYDWRVALGEHEQPLSRAELTRLAKQKAPLVRIRGRWIELDQDELRAAIAHVERVGEVHHATVGQLTTMAVGAAGDVGGLHVSAVTDAAGTDIVELLSAASTDEQPFVLPPPAGLEAELRPYQARGFAWLVAMGRLGLGACLADDMGLGKSVQALAAIQHAHEHDTPEQRAATLIVCPTSVVTNWQREAQRFTPALDVRVHHGSGRARGAELARAASDASIIITSYALLARDADALAAIDWRMVVLDEAQNIKHPGTQHATAARRLRAPARIALTGTPVENHVGDLWSIMQFLNPGLLGTQADFRRRYLLPIQTGALDDIVVQLRRVVSPFVMRREKTDRAVIADLPDKLEQTTTCSLTAEQVTLYEAIVGEAELVVRMPRGAARRSGIERRGLILATLSRLKQACNHPAQLLGDNSRIAGRSGKLARLEELLETVLEQGERALVFTQFTTMGELLQRQLGDVFARKVLYLHGGTPRAERDRIVERFQAPGAGAPPILVLSLKAGGSGLNLTAATHVVHFDRWWNPAVEQQASDRAFRIGQTRDVQVHAFVCAGTIEERIDRMLRQKRAVAGSIIGSGEQWITELEDDELLDLLRLRSDTLLQPGSLDSIDPKEWQHVSL